MFMKIIFASVLAQSGSMTYILLFILLALVIAVYLWRNSHRQNEGRAENLEKTYTELDRKTLDGIPDGELVDAVIANLMKKLDLQNPDAYKTITVLSRGRCAVFSVWLAYNEVKKSGICAFLQSPSRQFTDLAGDGFELIGAEECAALMRSSMMLDLLDEDAMKLFDGQFTAAVQKENPLELCRDYIRTNPDDFLDDDSDQAGVMTDHQSVIR